MLSDRKFNAVFYGIEEPSAGTVKSARQSHDLDKLLNIFTDIGLSLSAASIKDYHRLGKFKQSANRPRPILVKFLRAFEASLVLSKKGSLTSSSISIKPDMSRSERETEQILLRERRKLIDSGTDRKLIRIYGSSLYVNRKLYGSVQHSQFCLVTLNSNSQPMSVDSATAPPMDISNNTPQPVPPNPQPNNVKAAPAPPTNS